MRRAVAVIFGASATHALRALVQLASLERDVPVLGRDLARGLGIPPHYLAKVLATLARSGVLVASRGARGGYRLARRADEITLREVVEPLEGERVRGGCVLRPKEACSADGPCSAHAAWSEVTSGYSSFLDSTTLADIRGATVPHRHDGRKRGRPSRNPTRPQKRG